MKTLNLYRDKRKHFRWRLIASNGEIQANGAGDGYKRRRTLDAAIRSVFGWDGSSGATIGELMQWNRPDMRLEDDTILSHVMPVPTRPVRVPATKRPKRVRPPRKRTPAQKAARQLTAAKKRRSEKRKGPALSYGAKARKR